MGGTSRKRAQIIPNNILVVTPLITIKAKAGSNENSRSQLTGCGNMISTTGTMTKLCARTSTLR